MRTQFGDGEGASGNYPTIRGWRPKSPEEIQKDRERVEGDIAFEIQQLENRVGEVSADKISYPGEFDKLTPDQRELAKLQRNPGIYAYGGNAFTTRHILGDWPQTIPEGALSDKYGISSQRTAYGVGETAYRKFLIYRTVQNPSNRGGYAYTLLIDPGEPVWRLCKGNGAALLLKILEDPEIQKYLLDKPENVGKKLMDALVEKLKQSDLSVEPELNPITNQVRDFFAKTAAPEPIIVVGTNTIKERPNIEDFAHAVAAVSPELRENATWLIGGGEVSGQALGAKLVWDPKKE